MRTGNDRYEGFAIEIIQELSKILHFNYTFIETDPDYGTRGKDNKWSGMLGMIIDGVNFKKQVFANQMNGIKSN